MVGSGGAVALIGTGRRVAAVMNDGRGVSPGDPKLRRRLARPRRPRGLRQTLEIGEGRARLGERTLFVLSPVAFPLLEGVGPVSATC